MHMVMRNLIGSLLTGLILGRLQPQQSTTYLKAGLTYCPVKAEIGGSSPLWVANFSSSSVSALWAQALQQHPHQLP